LSLFRLITRVFYDEKIVRFNFIYRKATISYEDIKEIFIEYDLIKGYSVICNLETEINCNCRNYLEYVKKCKELNIDKVLMTCLKENIPSAKSIMNNGGVLENEIEVEGKIYQRYWIDLTK
jgi:hypothetical protein